MLKYPKILKTALHFSIGTQGNTDTNIDIFEHDSLLMKDVEDFQGLVIATQTNSKKIDKASVSITS